MHCILIITSCAGGRLNMPRPLQVDLWPFDLESGVRVTCDVGYLCTNFSLPRPLCSRLRPDVRDRQTSDAHHRLMPPTLGAGHNNNNNNNNDITSSCRYWLPETMTAVSSSSSCSERWAQCSRIRILCFFFKFQKNMTFYVFLKWRIKKS